MQIKEADVWKVAREYGGIAVQYGSSSGIYEVILPGHKQCCVVVSDNPAVDPVTRKIAKSISSLCFRVGSVMALKNVLTKLKMGGYGND